MKNNITKTLEDIEKSLPKYEPMSVIRGEQDLHGAAKFIENKLNKGITHTAPINWEHGWLFTELKYVPQIKKNLRDHISVTLVAKTSHQEFLNSKDINSIAVGLPFAYVNNFDETTYIKEIQKIKNDFNLIVVCIHQDCVDKGFWINSFEKIGVPFIIGSKGEDANGLLRVNRILKHFEYMTTNTMGSHVLYASYAGCKVSVYGTYQSINKADYRDDPFYKNNRDLLDHNVEQYKYEIISNKFSFLFTSPKNAKKNLLWAKKEIGEKNMVSLDVFCAIFQVAEQAYILAKEKALMHSKEIEFMRDKMLRIESNKWYNFGLMSKKDKIKAVLKAIYKKIFRNKT
ncbi:hypothetical protein [Francisella adeliensis]|uniref:Uncharacterized protein n=1 Tax=Francisella adeliensis TaxID=2007306 RepID=A0A2Z4XWY1_9GAMM|nr:hypothetical protein [Francisella adeliensis]AXA33397.1 hypothetical protein CDH04_02745 [Francisella adeliensis]